MFKYSEENGLYDLNSFTEIAKVIQNKYGMLLDNDGIKFKDYKSMKSFIINCLNDSVFKELKEIGIIASFNKQIQNVNPQKTLVKIKDLKIDLEKDNNK